MPLLPETPSTPSAPSRRRRLLERRLLTVLCRSGVLIGLVLLGIRCLIALKVYTVWDDAYMFVRYADNFIAEGRIVWNPGGAPTYGLTSLLYLVVVVPLRLLLPSNPLATALLSSLLCGGAFLALLLHFLFRATDRATPQGKLYILLVVLVLANAHADLTVHFLDGMDTAFALFYTTLVIVLWHRHRRVATPASSVVLGLVGGVAFWVRPDLCLYTIAIPACVLLLERDRRRRRQSGFILGLTLLCTAELVLVSWLALDSPFPLPFYCKSLVQYGREMSHIYSRIPAEQLWSYLGRTWPLWLLAGAGLLRVRLPSLAGERGLGLGLLLATVLFVGYYWLFVIQIMFYHSRFYYPTLPALVVLGARGLEGLQRSIEHTRWSFARVLAVAWSLCATAAIGVMAWSAHSAYLGHLDQEARAAAVDRPYTYKWDWREVLAHRRSTLCTYWFMLDDVSILPDDLVIATTEVGYVAATNPRKTLIDLAGLNQTDFAHRGFSPELLFEKLRPDFIYMPHYHYTRMIQQIESYPAFKRDFVYLRRETIQRDFGIAYRRDGRHGRQIQQAIAHQLEETQPSPLPRWARPQEATGR
jgi:hypothetical protein